jgi:hypothetical protein
MHRHRFASALLPSLVVLLVGAASSPAAAGTTSLPVRLPRAAVPQITRPMPVAYDPVAMYEAQSTCDPSPKPGTVKLAALIKKTYGEGQAVGISRACTSGGTSEHKEGRALDWMTSVHSRQGLANAKAFLSWLLGPDQFGVPYGNATRLGVMYVGWNDRYWAAYATDRGWAELKGCFSTPGAGSDTTCHRNHIHISLNWDGASGRTSLWDGTVLSPYCPYPWTGAIVAEAGRAADAIAIAPVRVLSTRDGLGLSAGSGQTDGGGPHDDGGFGPQDAFREDVVDPVPEPLPAPDPSTAAAPPIPCRVHPSGWHGGGGVLTKVTGQGGIPEVGVAAVTVKVTALGSTAPASIGVWAAGQATSQVVTTVRMNGRAMGEAIVPVSADGTIALGTSAGGTDLTVDVIDYYLIGDQPNVTVVP